MQLPLHVLALALVPQSTFLPDQPAWVKEGASAFEHLGWTFREAGDVDGDGRTDLLLHVRDSPALQNQYASGRVEIYRGTAQGYETTPMWTVRGGLPFDGLDWDAAGIGDVDKDGFDDVAFASSSRMGATTTIGAVFVFYGGFGGPNGGVDAVLGDADWIARGDDPNGWGFGRSIVGPGDVTGDGFDDLLIGCTQYESSDLMHPNEGRVLLFPGSLQGLPGGQTADAGLATWSVESDRAQGQLGTRLHAIGDVTDDGIADFAIAGAAGPQDPTAQNRIWVVAGAPGGPAPGLTNAFATFGGNGAPISVEVAAADFDLDGIQDIVLGYPNNVTNGVEPLVIQHGGSGGFRASPWRVVNVPWVEGAGTDLATGDFDGDGNVDLAVVSTAYRPPGIGRVRVFAGQPQGSYFPLSNHAVWERDVINGVGGRVEAVGDPDGDGVVALGVQERTEEINGMREAGRASIFTQPAPDFEGCAADPPDWELRGQAPEDELGQAVTLGDFNGDGFDDALVVGARAASLEVYDGSANGLATTPSWTYVSAHPAAAFGFALGRTGKVNDDEFDDAIVSLRGRAFDPTQPSRYEPPVVLVFHGSLNGLGSAPEWTAAAATSDPIHFGMSASIVGDLDADGFDDVAIGAPGHRNWGHVPSDPFDLAGAAYVYYGPIGGGAPGDETNADWSATDGDPDARFGRWVRGAGDIDLDGDDELIVAAPWRSTGSHVYAGRLSLWRGAPRTNMGQSGGVNDGIPGDAINAWWTLDGADDHVSLGNVFDCGVDVSGDGVPDLVTLVHDDSDMPGFDVHRGFVTGFTGNPQTVTRPGPRQFGVALLAEDFDGDGDGDILAANPYGSYRALRDGAVELYSGGTSSVSSRATWRGAGGVARVALGQWLQHGATGDVNGDGLADLVIGNPPWTADPVFPRYGRYLAWHGSRRPTLEIDPGVASVGDVVRVAHQGRDTYASVALVPVSHNGAPIAGGGRLTIVLASGRADGEGCWATDWTVPPFMSPGVWQLRTVVQGRSGKRRSRIVELVVQ